MKKRTLIMLTFVPMLVGYLVNLTLTIPVIGMALFYVLPLLTTVFWFHLGRQFARSSWKAVPAILIGNATGIVSFLVYWWQFVLETDETRNIPLAVASQMFSASTPLYLLGKFALLFESQPNFAGRRAMVALQGISVVYMAAVFCAAMIRERMQMKA